MGTVCRPSHLRRLGCMQWTTLYRLVCGLLTATQFTDTGCGKNPIAFRYGARRQYVASAPDVNGRRLGARMRERRPLTAEPSRSTNGAATRRRPISRQRHNKNRWPPSVMGCSGDRPNGGSHAARNAAKRGAGGEKCDVGHCGASLGSLH